MTLEIEVRSREVMSVGYYDTKLFTSSERRELIIQLSICSLIFTKKSVFHLLRPAYSYREICHNFIDSLIIVLYLLNTKRLR